MSESVDYGGANAKSGEGAGARHKSDFGEVLPISVVFLQFVMNKF